MYCFVYNKIENSQNFFQKSSELNLIQHEYYDSIDAGNENAEFKFDHRDSSRFITRISSKIFKLQRSLRQIFKANEITFKMISGTCFHVEFFWRKFAN